MYFEHFGLTQPPFKIVPNHEFYYSGGSRADILSKLVYAITCNDGLLIKIVGEPGTGKTMLAHMLEMGLPPELEVHKIPSLALHENGVPWAIADAMGLNLGKLDYGRAVLVLQQHLTRIQNQGRKVSLFIDEAQTLTAAVLEEIYHFASPENEPFKLVQVVLFGQTELDLLLNQPQLRNIRDQVTHSFSLKHLGREEVGDYLIFRMRTAGYRGPQVFSKEALKLIFHASKGSIRRINILADKALLAAFLDNTHLVKRDQVNVALRESWFEPVKFSSLPQGYLALLAGSVILTVFLWGVKWWVGDVPAPEKKIAAASVKATGVHRESNGKTAGTDVIAQLVPAEPAASSARVSVSQPAVAQKVAPSPDVAKRDGVGGGIVKGQEELQSQELVKKKSSVSSAADGGSMKNSLEKIPRSLTPTDASSGEIALQNRLEKSLEWLKKQDDGHLTIQLAIASPEQALSEIQRIHSRSQLKPDQVAAYRTLADGKPIISIVSGVYSTMREAREAVASLPPQLLEYSPMVRTFKGIRNEINK